MLTMVNMYMQSSRPLWSFEHSGPITLCAWKEGPLDKKCFPRLFMVSTRLWYPHGCGLTGLCCFLTSLTVLLTS